MSDSDLKQMEIESEELKVKSTADDKQDLAAAADEDKLGSSKESPQLPTDALGPTSTETSEPNAATPAPKQLTIFYGGKVLVFDKIPAEKAREIMLIATAAAAAVKPVEVKKSVTEIPASNSPVLTRSPSLQSATSALPSPQAQLYPAQSPSLCKMQAELPIARRHSLQRFFEKRRDRLGSRSPYPTPASKMAEDKKADVKAEAKPDAGYTAPENEIKPEATANVA